MRTCQLPQRAFQGDIVGARPSIRHAAARVQNPGKHAKASRVVICRAHEQDPQLSHEAKGVYRLLRQKQTIGAEHGEGFLHYRSAGPLQVDVEALNDALRTHGALRLRHSMHPHEANGMIFNFDGVVANLNAIKSEAWALLAQQLSLPLPSGILNHPEMYRMPPEVAAVRLLRWANNQKEARDLAMQHAALAADVLRTHSTPLGGVREWLDTLGRFNIPCALVSSLDRSTVQQALARMTLHDHFTVMVTAEDEFDSISQRLLSAAMKLNRAPNMCVYYDSCPQGVTAAHNCTMKAVAVQGQYHAYQLKAADVTCSNLTELAVYNMRRLFANMGSEFMDLQKQQSHHKDDNNGNQRKRRITNAML